MSDDLAPPIWTGEVAPAPLFAAPPPEHVLVLGDRGPDPLEHGFDLTGEHVAPLPPKVRLPHEDDDEDADDGGQPVDA
jgi:hypothetical protein